MSLTVKNSNNNSRNVYAISARIAAFFFTPLEEKIKKIRGIIVADITRKGTNTSPNVGEIIRDIMSG